MAATEAQIGYGATFAIGNGGTPTETFTPLAEVISITPPSDNIDVVEATHLTSPNRTKEYVIGLNDPGECALSLNFLPGEADDDAIQALRGLTSPTNFKITFPAISGNPVVSWTFAGYLTGYEPDVPIGDRMTANVRIKVTGSYTVS